MPLFIMRISLFPTSNCIIQSICSFFFFVRLCFWQQTLLVSTLNILNFYRMLLVHYYHWCLKSRPGFVKCVYFSKYCIKIILYLMKLKLRYIFFWWQILLYVEMHNLRGTKTDWCRTLYKFFFLIHDTYMSKTT